jgi:polyhydroxyalkanoate synthesis regulator phasin
MNRLLAAGGVIVGLIIGTFAIAAVGAQEDSPTPSPSPSNEEDSGENRGDRYKELLSENLGISPEDLEAAIKQTHLDLIDEALADGKITEEQAAEARERVESGEKPFRHFRGGGGPRGDHSFGFRGIHWLADTAKEILGLEDGAILDAYANGKSLADLAEEKGISVDDFKSQLLAAAKTKLDEKVAEGDITQEQADNKLERLTNNIDDIINFTPPALPEEGQGFRFSGPEGGITPGLPFFETEAATIDA